MRVRNFWYSTRTWRRGFFALVVVVSLVAQSLAVSVSALSPQDTYAWLKNLGTSGCKTEGSPAQMRWGANYAVTVKNDKVYATGDTDRMVYVAGTDGSSVVKFGGYGTSGNGLFREIDGIAVDSSGNIYVTDRADRRVQKFDANGNFLLQFGVSGTGDGEFQEPYGIAIDANGNVYVADTWNQRIQKFDTNGTYVSQFGSGYLNYPYSLSTDASGNIYVINNYSDGSNPPIQKFDSNGVYITGYGNWGSGDGQFNDAKDVAIGANGHIYVADTGNYRIQELNSNGNYIGQFGIQGSGEGQFQRPTGVALDTSDNIYVVDDYNSDYGLQKFTSNGTFIQRIGYEISPATPPYDPGPESVCMPWNISRDPSGNIYVVNQGENVVKKYSPSGVFLGTIGTPYTNGADPYTNGLLYQPFGIAVDASGNVYISDVLGRIQKFDPNGNYLSQFGSPGTGNGQFQAPYGVAVDSSGNVYVADLGNNRVQKFDSSGSYLSQFGSAGTGDGQFQAPVNIAFDANGNILVTDAENGRVQKFDSNGNYLSQFGTAGTGDSQFLIPLGIATDLDGNVYITDLYNSKVSIWNSPIIPSAPQNITTTTSPDKPTEMTVSWQPPAHVGSSPVTSYVVSYREQGTNEWKTVVVNGSTYSTVLTGLNANTTYEVKVTAINAIGTSATDQTTAVTGTTGLNLLAPNSGAGRVLMTVLGVAMLGIFGAALGLAVRTVQKSR